MGAAKHCGVDGCDECGGRLDPHRNCRGVFCRAVDANDGCADAYLAGRETHQDLAYARCLSFCGCDGMGVCYAEPAISPTARAFAVLCGVWGGSAAGGSLFDTVSYVLLPVVDGPIAAGLVMLTPVYFMFSMYQASRTGGDRAALLLGLILGPLFYYLFPGADLLLTGIVGGTVAFTGWLFATRRAEL